MRISDIEIIPTGSACQLQARVESDREEDHDEWFEAFVLWLRFPAWCRPFLTVDNGDPFVAALLVAAMRTSERLSVPAPVSPTLLEALPEIQSIYTAFDKRAHRVSVETDARGQPFPAGLDQSRNGLFFSLGVDSYYSLLKNRRVHAADSQTTTHLISVRGFDVADEFGDRDISPQMLANLRRAARETKTTFLPVETNVRRATRQLAPWSIIHGGAMASIALALGGMFQRVLIAASATYDTVAPWGTHPLLDPLWSTESLRIVHDGCEMDTIDKTWFNTGSDLFLETVRVCPGYGPEYNCGRCLKCMRTMLDLWLSGHLYGCPTLPHSIDAECLREALVVGQGPVHLAAFRRRLAYFEATDGPPGVREVLAEHLNHDRPMDRSMRANGWCSKGALLWRRASKCR
jgi:hypothetical protein